MKVLHAHISLSPINHYQSTHGIKKTKTKTKTWDLAKKGGTKNLNAEKKRGIKVRGERIPGHAARGLFAIYAYHEADSHSPSTTGTGFYSIYMYAWITKPKCTREICGSGRRRVEWVMAHTYVPRRCQGVPASVSEQCVTDGEGKKDIIKVQKNYTKHPSKIYQVKVHTITFHHLPHSTGGQWIYLSPTSLCFSFLSTYPFTGIGMWMGGGLT